MAEFEPAKATINDVAAAAGVSKKTVSRVINNEPNVRKETRARVQEAMSALNYFPNMSARSLASKRSYLVAMLYFDVGAFYLHQLQSGLLDHCALRGYSLLMQPCEGEVDQIVAMIEQKARYMNIDGFVLVPPLVCIPAVAELLKRMNKPYVRITPMDEYDGFSEVLCDDEQSTFELTSHLIAQGHKDIAFVKGDPSCLATKMRFDGFSRALDEHNIVMREEWVVDGTYAFESGVEAGHSLFRNNNSPSAIVCSNDDMAAGVLSVVHEKGLRVPQDVSITGFDDSPLASQTWPALTSVRQPNRRMAEIAANKLIDRIENIEGAEYSQNLSCEIVYRASTEGKAVLNAAREAEDCTV